MYYPIYSLLNFSPMFLSETSASLPKAWVCVASLIQPLFRSQLNPKPWFLLVLQIYTGWMPSSEPINLLDSWFWAFLGLRIPLTVPSINTKWKLLSRSNSLWLHELDSPWNSPGQNTRVGSISTLQGSNPGLPHYRWILYQLSHKGSLFCKGHG